MNGLNELLDELAALRARVAALETSRGTVCTPFRVVDPRGRTAFTVTTATEDVGGETARLQLYDLLTGEPLAEIRTVATLPAQHPDNSSGRDARGSSAISLGFKGEVGGHQVNERFYANSLGTLVLSSPAAGADPHCESALMLRAEAQTVGIGFQLASAGEEPVLNLVADEDGHGLFMARCDPADPLAVDGPPAIYLGNRTPSREPVLALWNLGEAPVVELGADPDAHGYLKLDNRQGCESLVLSASS